MKVTEVYCTVQVEGTHNWPNCPITEVGYLQHPHRHLFIIKAYVNVSHHDRDVEFIQLGHQIRSYLLKRYGTDMPQAGCYGEHVCIFGARSCEMIGDELMEEFGLSKIEVSEDGENGAIITKVKIEDI